MTKKLLTLALMAVLFASPVFANVNCSKLGNEEARKNCRERKADNNGYDVNKKKIDCRNVKYKNRDECRNFKYDR